MRLPIGLSFGQKRRAVVSLMMTTAGRSAVSAEVNVRPEISRIPRVSK
jgi:hypothetical protein